MLGLHQAVVKQQAYLLLPVGSGASEKARSNAGKFRPDLQEH